MNKETGTEEVRFGPVWFIPGENSGKYPYCHSLYIEDAGILIDPASDRQRLIELKKSPGVREVWLSHWHEDHFMHLDLFDDLPLKISEPDSLPLESIENLIGSYGIDHRFMDDWEKNFIEIFNYRPRKPSGYLLDGQELDLGGVRVRVILTPGHTPGSTSLLFPDQKLLFQGDYDLSRFGPWYGDAHSSIPDTIRSVRMLQSLPAETWVVSHEKGVFYEAPESLWNDYLGVIDYRENRLLEFLSEPRTMEDIIAACIVYRKPREPKMFFEFGEKAIMGKHLALLLETGAVKEEGNYFSVC